MPDTLIPSERSVIRNELGILNDILDPSGSFAKSNQEILGQIIRIERHLWNGVTAEALLRCKSGQKMDSSDGEQSPKEICIGKMLEVEADRPGILGQAQNRVQFGFDCC